MHGSSSFPVNPKASSLERPRKKLKSRTSSPLPENKLRKPLFVLVEATSERGNAPKVGASTKEAPEGSQSQSKAQSQLDFLEKLTAGRQKGSSMADPEKTTIAEQLANKTTTNSQDAAVPLCKKEPMEYDDLTISQKRNIRRQQYLDQVSKRNDVPFFTTVALFVILPPVIILGVAVATGYVDLLP